MIIVMFYFTLKLKSRRFQTSGLKRVFEKLRFRDGLVWIVGLIVVFRFLWRSVGSQDI